MLVYANKYLAHFILLFFHYCRQMANSFKPGGIHACLGYWADVLKAGSWVLDIIENGYSVPFKTIAPEAEFPNNAGKKK